MLKDPFVIVSHVHNYTSITFPFLCILAFHIFTLTFPLCSFTVTFSISLQFHVSHVIIYISTFQFHVHIVSHVHEI